MLRYTFLLIAAVLHYSSAVSIPADFPRCTIDDPNLDNCIIEATKTVQKRIRYGVKELGLPSLDPFLVPAVTLHQENGAMKYNVGLKNVILNGAEDYKIEKLHYDTVNHVLNGVVTFDKFFVRGNYDFEGTILAAPLKANGVLKIVTGNATASFIFTGQLKEIDGKTYVVYKDAEIKLHIVPGQARFSGSVNDNDELSRWTNRILNDNVGTILSEACPQITMGTKAIVLQYWDSIISKVPYDELLPHSS